MDTRIIDVFVERDSDTEAVQRAIVTLDEADGEYEVCQNTTENGRMQEDETFSPRAIYSFTGKYRYRICIWCLQDLSDTEEIGQSMERENRMIRRFLEKEEKQRHVIVCARRQTTSDSEKQEKFHGDPGGIVFTGEIFF